MYYFPLFGFLFVAGSVRAQDGTDSEPRLMWYNPSPPQTCTNVTFSWLYSGPALSATVSIMNLGVTQASPPTSSVFESQLTNRAEPTTYAKRALPALVVLVAESVPAFGGKYDWAKVIVPQGWYILQAIVDHKYYPSVPFFIFNGTDVSCINLLMTTDLTSSDPTSSLNTIKPATLSSTPAQTSARIEPPHASATTQSRKNLIAGSVCGVLAGIAVVIILAVRYKSWSCTRRLKSRRIRFSDPVEPMRKSTNTAISFPASNTATIEVPSYLEGSASARLSSPSPLPSSMGYQRSESDAESATARPFSGWSDTSESAQRYDDTRDPFADNASFSLTTEGTGARHH